MAQHDKNMIVAVLKFMLWLSNLRMLFEYEEFNFHELPS